MVYSKEMDKRSQNNRNFHWSKKIAKNPLLRGKIML
jgi:hypothetical protein